MEGGLIMATDNYTVSYNKTD